MDEKTEMFVPEIGDKVEFHAAGDYGLITGTGFITRVYKKGKIRVEMGGETYESSHYEILSKAG